MHGWGGHGVVAAGHPLTAQAGARVLREGGNAVDAALGGDACVVRGRAAADGARRGRLHARRRRRSGAGAARLLRAAPSDPRAADAAIETVAELEAIDVSFGDAAQVFYIGPASCGVYGVPAGVCEAARRWGTIPLAELAAPAARLAREGVALNAGQAYVAEILADLLTATPECAALWAPAGHVLREGEVLRNAELGDALDAARRATARSRSTAARSRAPCATGCARAAAG